MKMKYEPNLKTYLPKSIFIIKKLARLIPVCGLLLAVAVAADAVTLWHNTDTTTIVASNSISCNLNGEHDANSYWRAFTLSSFGYTGGIFTPTGVRIGIEEATAGSGGTSQPISVRIYANNIGTFPAGATTLIGSTDTTVANGTLFFQDIPVVVPPQAVGTQIVVEVFTPDGHALHNHFFIGSNNLGQSAPGYISAAGCGAPIPTNVAVAGAPNMHMLIGLVGLGPTAADVSVAGRVVTANGRGIGNARISITLPTGEVRSALSSPLGYYNFDDMAAGHTYILSIADKRYTFSEPTRVLSVSDELNSEDFIAIE